MKTKIIAIISLLSCTSMYASSLLVLKGDRLYKIDGSDYTYITAQVTKILPREGLFLKEDRLYRLSEDGTPEFVAQQVSEVCEGGNHVIKQTRLYALDGIELTYITGGVTACR